MWRGDLIVSDTKADMIAKIERILKSLPAKTIRRFLDALRATVKILQTKATRRPGRNAK